MKAVAEGRSNKKKMIKKLLPEEKTFPGMLPRQPRQRRARAGKSDRGITPKADRY